MNVQRAQFAVWFAILTVGGCRDPSDPSRIAAANFAMESRVQGVMRRFVPAAIVAALAVAVAGLVWAAAYRERASQAEVTRAVYWDAESMVTAQRRSSR